MQLFGQILQVILGHFGDGERRQVGVAQLQDSGAQEEGASVTGYVAQGLQGDQEAPGRGSGHPGLPGHLGQGHPRSRRSEGTNDGEAALQGLDELRRAFPAAHDLGHRVILGTVRHAYESPWHTTIS